MQIETLTVREKQIYKLLLTEPLNQDELSEILHIELPTLKTHCLHIYDKLCVKNRIELLIEYINNNCKVL
jgi:DNA-binding CsgD family transcriptional regulator